ncbi:MAG TPA: DUF6064 family protein [Gemmatimonadales bacterium]|nr:DUF6064 family protein [Gemmatimonadales bacterium]
MLPFTAEAFLGVFAAYHQAVWPAPVVAAALGLAVTALALRPTPRGARAIGLALAALWAWTGIAYHALHFAAINRAAPAFAVLFVVQSLLLAQSALARAPPAYGGPVHPLAAAAGWSLVAYAGVLYPLVALAAGHRYPALPTFGITPCPLTLFTVGLLLLVPPPVPARLLVVPFLWSVIGATAAVLLGMVPDWPLLATAAALPLLWRGRPRGRALPVSR